MTVRRCTTVDIDHVYTIEEKSFSDPMKKETMYKDLMRQSYFCYGLFDCDMVAFMSYEKVFDEGQIISVATSPEVRKKGYAKKLFDAVISLAKKDGINLFTLEVRGDNTPALSLYKSLGFKEVGVRKNYYVNPVCDAVLMDLHLRED